MHKTPPELAAGLDLLMTAARTRSATRTARHLKTTPATVLRRLASIEYTLGARLFDRTPGGLVATAALLRILPWAERAAGAIDGLVAEVDGLETQPVGIVRVALLPGLAAFIASRGLNELLASNPGLSVDLISNTRVADLTRREADLALRTVRPAEGEVVAQRLLTFRLAVMATPRLAQEVGRKGLRTVGWITFTDEGQSTAESLWLRASVPEARIVVRAPDLETQLVAARAGAGVVVVAEPLGRLTSGLVEIPTSVPTANGSLWIAAHRDLRRLPRVAAAWNWLVSAFKIGK